MAGAARAHGYPRRIEANGSKLRLRGSRRGGGEVKGDELGVEIKAGMAEDESDNEAARALQIGDALMGEGVSTRPSHTY